MNDDLDKTTRTVAWVGESGAVAQLTLLVYAIRASLFVLASSLLILID